MRVMYLLLVFCLTGFLGFGQQAVSAKEIIGYEIGNGFSRHAQVSDYFHKLHEVYPMNTDIHTYGYTYEGRELFLFFLGKESHINDLTNLKYKNRKQGNTGDTPVIWLSYNVHGNESSGSEAAMETALILLQEKRSWLDSALVIIDPCLNPDGRDRYVNFFNQYSSKANNPNSQSIEHQEPWPGGRLNHYLFDLNRDWAWLTQIESEQRIKVYNEWLPHVHVDFHEQGINENYYFPPAAEPYHEIITDWQREFQQLIGKNHAAYFDKNDWLYFSDEIFDLLYPSYGDTYPMFNGAIGMTYEQAGSGRAGKSVILANGDTLTLRDRIDHHVTTGLSTIEVAIKHRERLVDEFRKFGQKQKYRYQSYLLSGNEYKISHLIDFLEKHEIQYGAPLENLNVKGWSYQDLERRSQRTKEGDIVISTNQHKGPLVKALFEPNTYLSDSLTYDITAWSLPYAFGLDAMACEELIPFVHFKENAQKEIEKIDDTYAYVCRWNSMESARFLERMLKENVAIRFAKKPFEINEQVYGVGTLIILVGDNDELNITEIIKGSAENLHVEIVAYNSGHVERGNDFGSSSFELITRSKIGVFIGDYFSPENVGELWHFFENDLQIDFDMLDISNFTELKEVTEYDILILPEGELSPEFTEMLEEWVSQGGNLILFGRALRSFSKKLGLSEEEWEEDQNSFNLDEREEVSHMITGAIYECEIDPSSPLSFGYQKYYTLRQNRDVYRHKGKAGAFSLPDNAKQIAGFVGSNVAELQSKALIAGVGSINEGRVIYFVDNPLFRCFWQNGKLMVANALYFVNE